MTNLKKGTWRSPFGKQIHAFWRDGKNDWNTLQSILKEDEYGLKALCSNPKHVIDIGGHIGGFALLAASQGATVRVVEILPENADIILRSANLNSFGSNLRIYQRAIAEKSGETIKAYYMDTSTHTGDHHEFVGNTESDTGGRSIEVETISLDELCADLPYVDILKVDCEGAEWPMLAGASEETLNKINLIVGEIHPWGDNTIDDMRAMLPNHEDISASLGGQGKPIDLIAFKRK